MKFMPVMTPATADEAASALRELSAAGRTVEIAGAGSKRGWGGRPAECEVSVSSQNLSGVIDYERNDLTVSVAAGTTFAELQSTLAVEGQMLGISPPFRRTATIGGVVATNLSNLWQRRFGSVRDQVIGLSAATMDGSLVQSGGMVVKNVAGLDLAKLLIGSFGTLAFLTSVNFRVQAMPDLSKTYVCRAPTLAVAQEWSTQLLRGPLRPLAVVLLNPAAALQIGEHGDHLLIVRGIGSEAVLRRYAAALPQCNDTIEGSSETNLWEKIREFAPMFFGKHRGGTVVRLSSNLATLADVTVVITEAPMLHYVGCGVSHVFTNDAESCKALLKAWEQRGRSYRIEAAPDDYGATSTLWWQSETAETRNAFATMKRVKLLFDSANLLNPGRCYGRL